MARAGWHGEDAFRQRHARLRAALLALSLACACADARAALVLAGTRLVYHGDARQARITVLDTGDAPALMQAWIDSGDAEAKPQDIQVPFVVTPPMVRIDPGQQQTLSVVFTGSALPADRESLYWLNVLDIPPRPQVQPGHNYLQFAVRTRIKLIYRPAGLKGDPEQAMGSLRWRETCEAGACSLEVRNPTAYCIPVVELRGASRDGRAFGPLQGTVMPFASLRWALERVGTVDAVKYAVINDYGALVHAHASVAR